MNLLDLLTFVLIDPWHFFGTVVFFAGVWIATGSFFTSLITTYFSAKTKYEVETFNPPKAFPPPSRPTIETRD